MKLHNTILMRPTILIIFISIVMSNLKAEIIRPTEKAIIEICYSKTVNRDTTRDDYMVTSPMILRIGDHGTMFFPKMTMNNDSLNYYNRELAIQVVIDALTKGLPVSSVLGHEHEYLFRNINKQETMVYQAVGDEAFYYIENTECPNWIIGEEMREINGMNCIEAHCSFHGREWTAWFAPEIPIKEGPWKLFGLLGLVIEAHDANCHYKFEVTGIRTENLAQVGIFIYDKLYPEKLNSRKDYLCRIYSLRIKGDFMKRVSSITGNNVIHTNTDPYDFEETDYPHN